MITLGVETSCDETSCAVLEGRSKIRSNIISSSLFRHRPYGGVVPEIASRHSLEQIDFVFREALRQGGVLASDLDLVAVTRGPGLIGSLLVGISFAKALSFGLGIPLVGVNHLEAHLKSNFIGRAEPSGYIGLIISGGHTSITDHRRGRTLILGETVDDACGEAFDKVAKILGLGYPGGPVIERLAKQGDPTAFRFTKPRQENRFNLSFSGIKTAVLYLARKHRVTRTFQKNVSASFQAAVVSWLVDKAVDAARFKKVKCLVVGGGVSANGYLRESLLREAARYGLEVCFPPMALTGDNAAMIARAGLERHQKGKRDSLKLTGDPNLRLA